MISVAKTRLAIVAAALSTCFILALPIFGSDVRFAQGKSAMAIPFEVDDTGQRSVIFLRVGVNGRAFSFILDTGASHSILGIRQAKALGLSLRPVGKVIDATGDAPSYAFLIAETVSLELPGVVLSNHTLASIELDAIQKCVDRASDGTLGIFDPNSSCSRKRAGRKVVDGILGKDFFESFVVEIDYSARKINLYDPPAYKHTGKGSLIPIEIEPTFTFVRVQVRSTAGPPVNARLIVDTGAGVALWLAKRFAQTHNLLTRAAPLTAFVDCGVGGLASDKSWAGRLANLRIGKHRLRDPITVFYTQPEIQGADGFLGSPALRNFDVTFDYSRNAMRLEQPGSLKRHSKH